jgi:sugar phosphate isomerase/epimerase
MALSNKLPKIYLAIDNCFASQRWTRPGDWMRLIADMGVNHVEASAYNEIDPLYSTEIYRQKWQDEVVEESLKTAVNICNLYSGHGTYSTTGLTHEDESVREHIMHDWIKKMIDTSCALEAGLGYFCHAFNNTILQDKEKYSFHLEDLYDRLAGLAEYAAHRGLKSMGLEQMYTPHQVPWTIKGARELMENVFGRSGKPIYITIDVGHQSGQRKFLKPDQKTLEKLLDAVKSGNKIENYWLGIEKAYDMFHEAVTDPAGQQKEKINEILELADEHNYLFAEYDDGDPYNWLSTLGCYSPIIHLQQTDGNVSAHWPFNDRYNAGGIITGDKVLDSLADSYRHTYTGMPPKCDEIYLTIEVFAETSELPYDILKKLEESVLYWRDFIPEDGLSLDELL